MNSPFGRAAKKAQNQVYGAPEILGRGDCSYCECWFFHRSDLEAHKESHWKKSRNGRGWSMPSKNDHKLAAEIRAAGPVEIGGFNYSLIDDKLLYRVRVAGGAY